MTTDNALQATFDPLRTFAAAKACIVSYAPERGRWESGNTSAEIDALVLRCDTRDSFAGDGVMPQFHVDDDVAAQVELLAKKRPFETLSFNDALKRILPAAKLGRQKNQSAIDLDTLFGPRTNAGPKKAPSPSASEWVAKVPELRQKRQLTNWKAICQTLNIDPAGDSARRKLKAWVNENRPDWPAVPEV